MAVYDYFVSLLCYEGEGDPAPKPSETPPPSGTDGGNNDGSRVFTQEDLNKILAEDKRKHQERYKQLESSYQELLQNQNLTTEERDSLRSRLEDLQKSFRTKEQQAEYERKQAEEKYRNELETATKRAEHWENLFKKETTVRSLQDAAAGADAFNPNQIVGLLSPFTELKEVEGKLMPMVDFPDIDEKTGEEIRTLRTPVDAVKRMRELPKMYGNLFKSNVVSGVGAGNAGPSANADDIDYSSLTPDQYRKHRKEIKERLGQRSGL
ncbi:hypothetical protein DRJ25_05120 [Candidatus Woesearchaeota archaeon]|nr:MAG: hypothetical protein DRJ25_05120 [Candidatus Woesearchaeota archaeon]